MYKLVPNDLNLDLIYIGSTTNFRARKNSHKEACMNPNGRKYNYKVYKMIRENGGWSEWQMLEIEKYSCADSNECRKRERELMEQFNCNLNTKKAYISHEEAIILKNKYNTQYNPIYRLANREMLNAKQREKYQQKKLTSLNLEN
jgi:thioester reductase-like protein